MNWRQGLLAFAIIASLLTVIVGQNQTIQDQRVLIRSFYQDPVCMHDPRH